MHILIIPSWYSTSPDSYLGSFFREQALAIKKFGNHVCILYIDYFGGQKKFPYYTCNAINEDDLRVYSIRLPHLFSKFPFVFPKILFFFGTLLFKYYVNHEGKPDIIHAQSALYGGFIASVIQKKFKVPYVITEHYSKIIKNEIPFWKKLEVLSAYDGAEGISAVSQALVDAMGDSVSKEIKIIGNMVDDNFFDLPASAISNTPFIFFSLGNLKKIKCFDLLIKAFYKSFYKEDVKLLIGGTGEEEERLRKLIHDFNLCDQVLLLGRLSRDEVKKFLHSSHIIVSSSAVETFGITLIEGMSCGLPVVSTMSGGPDRFVDQENGLLVPTGNIEELANAMKIIKKNYNKYDSNKIRKKCIECFGQEVFIKKSMEFYSEALAVSKKVLNNPNEYLR